WQNRIVIAIYIQLPIWNRIEIHIALFRLSSGVGDKWTRIADIRHKVLSWNPILTKDSCGSGGFCYRRTRNGGELSPF
ncbi:hypothetical protein Gotur_018026, partial [Gossypium turneri]